MVAGFERDDCDPYTVKGKGSACGREGGGFSVRGASAFMCTGGHDFACRVEKNAADGGIRRRGALKGASQRQCLPKGIGESSRR